MDWLQNVANIAQIVGVIWVLLFGGKAVADVIRDFRIGIPIKVNPLVTLNILVAAIFVVLLGILVRPIFLPLPFFSSRTMSTPTTSPTAIVSTPTSTASPTATVSTNSHFAYDFEDGTTQGWDTSEGQYKLAALQVVSDPVRKGNHVLQVMTKLTGDANNEVYRHTSTKVYFTQGIPAGFSNSSPQNFQGKQVSCEVYLPQGLASGSPPPTISISVKDTSQRNDTGKPIPINASIVGKWMQLSFIVGQYQGDADQGFDGTHVFSIGVQIVVPPGSTLNYTGPFYVDNCILPH
jgi:hypothetical protein